MKDYGVELHHIDGGFNVTFTQGDVIKYATITELVELESLLEKWCEGYKELKDKS